MSEFKNGCGEVLASVDRRRGRLTVKADSATTLENAARLAIEAFLDNGESYQILSIEARHSEGYEISSWGEPPNRSHIATLGDGWEGLVEFAWVLP